MTDRDWTDAAGSCVTGKVRYADAETAAAALERVRAARAERPDGRPPERQFYACVRCEGWHLSSKPPRLDFDAVVRDDGESWEAYAGRLERRIKGQRDHLEAINELRADAGNRQERKRIATLQLALGRITERWHVEREARIGLVAAVKAAERGRLDAAGIRLLRGWYGVLNGQGCASDADAAFAARLFEGWPCDCATRLTHGRCWACEAGEGAETEAAGG